LGEAVISSEVPNVTTTPNSAQAESISPVGLSGTKLDADQRETLSQFVRTYYDNFAEPIRSDLLDQFARGRQDFHFAWFGPADPTMPHAFRVQGPTLLIDFNDKQDGANHIHTFYRSLLGDFGMPVAR